MKETKQLEELLIPLNTFKRDSENCKYVLECLERSFIEMGGNPIQNADFRCTRPKDSPGGSTFSSNDQLLRNALNMYIKQNFESFQDFVNVELNKTITAKSREVKQQMLRTLNLDED